MPNIFTPADREAIRSRLLAEGKKMMLESGITRMNLEVLAHSAGIAKGTFYRFFQTKQHFILAIIRQYQAQRAEVVEEEARVRRASLTPYQAVELYLSIYDPQDNPFFHMRDSDLNWIAEKIPPEELFDADMDLRCCRLLLSCVKNLREDADPRVVSNFFRMIMFTLMQQSYVHQEALPVNIRMIVDLVADYVVEPEGGKERSHEV